ncbi:MAG: hypothetical protein MZV63_17205 [Marinilabiliales bacterium]|nr:hypothetical protein [Marinilabiliales bacterium]
MGHTIPGLIQERSGESYSQTGLNSDVIVQISVAGENWSSGGAIVIYHTGKPLGVNGTLKRLFHGAVMELSQCLIR